MKEQIDSIKQFRER